MPRPTPLPPDHLVGPHLQRLADEWRHQLEDALAELALGYEDYLVLAGTVALHEAAAEPTPSALADATQIPARDLGPISRALERRALLTRRAHGDGVRLVPSGEGVEAVRAAEAVVARVDAAFFEGRTGIRLEMAMRDGAAGHAP